MWSNGSSPLSLLHGTAPLISLQRSRVIPKDYQLVPVVMALEMNGLMSRDTETYQPRQTLLDSPQAWSLVAHAPKDSATR